MKPISYLFILVFLILVPACRPQTAELQETIPETEPTSEPLESTPVATVENMEPTVTPGPTDEAPEATATPVAKPTLALESIAALPLLPIFQEANTNGIGDPINEGENDPFSEATFDLKIELPQGPATAVVQEHIFGLVDEAAAQKLAKQFGFDGPLYVQQIPPIYAPPEGEEAPVIFTAFDGRRILNVNNTGLTIEDRGVIVDYDKRPAFAQTAPLIEAKLKEWDLLDFPYEIQDLDGSGVMITRLINGIPTNQNEFNMFFNQDGELNYFDYRPQREVTDLGNYPLQSAAMAWQQVQEPEGRLSIRYQIWPLQSALEGPIAGFVNPRSWVPLSDPGQELHLYITPAVYEATDGSGLRLIYGDFTLAGDDAQLAEIASHNADVLHVWGVTGLDKGSKTLEVGGWEIVDMVNYETVEGTVNRENGQTLLQTNDGKTFILPGVPQDVEDGTDVYASIMAQRDTGADYPLLDWNSLTEKIEWPDLPVVTPVPEPGPITNVSIDEVALIYYALYQNVDVIDEELTLLFLPVWQFDGKSDQGQSINIWVPAVMPEHMETAALTQ